MPRDRLHPATLRLPPLRRPDPLDRQKAVYLIVSEALPEVVRRLNASKSLSKRSGYGAAPRHLPD